MIFMSYSWMDAEIVHRVKMRLASMGRDVWIDFEKLELNTPLESQIEDRIRQALRKSSCVLHFDSPNSQRSKWVKRELIWAKDAGIDLVHWPIQNARSDRANDALQALLRDK